MEHDEDYIAWLDFIESQGVEQELNCCDCSYSLVDEALTVVHCYNPKCGKDNLWTLTQYARSEYGECGSEAVHFTQKPKD